jgi:CDP-glycerol glycerophosphotransferase (TagB/SpsB family)
MRKIIVSTLRIVNKMFMKKEARFLFFSNPDFSDNPKALFDYLIKNYPSTECLWICEEPETLEFLRSLGYKAASQYSFIGFWWLLTSKILISSALHRANVASTKQIYVNLWHGMPLKAIGVMDPDFSDPKGSPLLKTKNTITICTSPLMKMVMAACFHTDARTVLLTGQPRCDALYSPVTVETLGQIFNLDVKEIDHVVLFMPTFRRGYLNRTETGKWNTNNLFGFKDYNHDEFLAFLKDNKIFFVCKLHPFEEKIFADRFEERSKWFLLLKNENIQRNGIDLYQVVGGADLLITDYSSVYLDYLMLDKPIIFTPTDLDEYAVNRGFLLEPYDFWAPGFKAVSQAQMQEALLTSLRNPEQYSKERETVRKIIHTYSDERSCERVARAIMDKIGEVN